MPVNITAQVTLSGGGTLGATARRHADASTATEMNQVVLGVSPMGGQPFTTTGGGQLDVSGGPGVQGPHASGTFWLSGEGVLTATGSQNAYAGVAVELDNWQLGVAYLGNDYQLYLSGGGAVAATGVTGTGPAPWSVTGGGELTAVGVKHAEGVATLTTGGDAAATAVKHAQGTLTLAGGGHVTSRPGGPIHISGGGTLAITGAKHARGVVAVSAGGTLAAAGSKHAVTTLALHGGGDVNAVGAKRAHTAVALTTGNTRLRATGVKGARVVIGLTGGGGCWGPYPWVLLPQIVLMQVAPPSVELVDFSAAFIGELALTRTGS